MLEAALNLVAKVEGRSDLHLVARRLGTTEEELRRAMELKWFVGEVLWKSLSTITLTCPDFNFNLVCQIERHVTPVVEYNSLRFVQSEPKRIPPAGTMLAFRLADKRDEILALFGSIGPTQSVQFSGSLQWCWPDVYLRAAEQADACPEYRLLTRQSVKVGEIPDPKLRRWVPQYRTDEVVRWKGFDLTKLRDYLQENHFTRYDRPTFQKRTINNSEWQDCPNPLAQETKQ